MNNYLVIIPKEDFEYSTCLGFILSNGIPFDKIAFCIWKQEYTPLSFCVQHYKDEEITFLMNEKIYPVYAMSNCQYNRIYTTKHLYPTHNEMIQDLTASGAPKEIIEKYRSVIAND